MAGASTVIVHNLTTSKTGGAGTSSLTSASFSSSILDPMLFAVVATRGVNTITSFTHGSGNTFVFLSTHQSVLSNAQVDMWYVCPTDASTGTATVTFDAAVNAAIMVIYRYGGVDQITPFGNSGSGDGNTSPATVSVTDSVTLNLLADGAVVYKGSSGVTITEDQGISRFNNTAGTGTDTILLGCHEVVGTYTLGSETLSWTESVNTEWGSLGVEIRPARRIRDTIRAGSPIPFQRA